MFGVGRTIRGENRDDAPERKHKRPLDGAWYSDPYGVGAESWWDGHRWTREVRGGPVPMDAPRRSTHVNDTHGTGSRSTPRKGARGRLCPHCQGTGQHQSIGGECQVCLGTGRVTNVRRWQYVILVAALIIALAALLLLLPGARPYYF